MTPENKTVYGSKVSPMDNSEAMHDLKTIEDLVVRLIQDFRSTEIEYRLDPVTPAKNLFLVDLNELIKALSKVKPSRLRRLPEIIPELMASYDFINKYGTWVMASLDDEDYMFINVLPNTLATRLSPKPLGALCQNYSVAISIETIK